MQKVLFVTVGLAFFFFVYVITSILDTALSFAIVSRIYGSTAFDRDTAVRLSTIATWTVHALMFLVGIVGSMPFWLAVGMKERGRGDA